MSLPKWHKDLDANWIGRYSKAGVWGYFTTKKGEKVEYTYGACFAGWIDHTRASEFVTFHLQVNDMLTPLNVKSNTAFDWTCKRARAMGFKFQRRNGYIIMDTTVMSGREMWLLGNIFRNLWENKHLVYTHMFLAKKHPEVDPITLYILSHFITVKSKWTCLGHTWMNKTLSYFKDNKNLTDTFLANVRKEFPKPYCKKPTYYKKPSDRLLSSVITQDIIGDQVTGNRRTSTYSPELFNSFFSEAAFDTFINSPENQRSAW